MAAPNICSKCLRQALRSSLPSRVPRRTFAASASKTPSTGRRLHQASRQRAAAIEPQRSTVNDPPPGTPARGQQAKNDAPQRQTLACSSDPTTSSTPTPDPQALRSANVPRSYARTPTVLIQITSLRDNRHHPLIRKAERQWKQEERNNRPVTFRTSVPTAGFPYRAAKSILWTTTARIWRYVIC